MVAYVSWDWGDGRADSISAKSSFNHRAFEISCSGLWALFKINLWLPSPVEKPFHDGHANKFDQNRAKLDNSWPQDLCAPSPNSESDSIMPYTVKSGIKNGFKISLSLSLEINHIESHNSFDKNWFSPIKSEIHFFMNLNSGGLACIVCIIITFLCTIWPWWGVQSSFRQPNCRSTGH